MEAKVAMDIAQVDGTSEFPLANINSKNMAGVQRTTVDLIDTPFKFKDEHLKRLIALSRTVVLGNVSSLVVQKYSMRSWMLKTCPS